MEKFEELLATSGGVLPCVLTAISIQIPAKAPPNTTVCMPVTGSLVICIAIPLTTGQRQKPNIAMQNMRSPLEIVTIAGGTYEMTMPTMEVVVHAPKKIMSHRQVSSVHMLDSKRRIRMGILASTAPRANHLHKAKVLAVLR